MAGTQLEMRLQSPAVIRRLFTVAVLTMVFVAAAIVVGVDIGARVYAEHQMADRAKSSTGAASASAGIHSFPFLYDLVVESKAKKVSLHLTRVPVGPLTIDKVDVTARGVHIDLGYLVHHQKVRIKSIDSADARLTFAVSDLSSVTGIQLSITGDTLSASVAGVRLPVSVTVADGHILTLDVEGRRAFGFDVDRSPIVPPCALNLTVSGGSVVLECSASPVPAPVVAAISAATSR